MNPLRYPSTTKGRALAIAHGRVQRPEGRELRYRWHCLRRDCEQHSVEPRQLDARCRCDKSKGDDASHEGKEQGEC
jgi:hypothetical protein